MKTSTSFALALSLGATSLSGVSFSASPCDGDRYLVVPGKCVGPVNPSTTFHSIGSDLRGHIVRPEPLEIGEGFLRCTTVVDPGTAREVFITWAADARRNVEWHEAQSDDNREMRAACAKIDFGNAPVAEVDIRAKGNPWHTREGIRIGLPLHTLRRIVPGKFTVSGLGWDYSGMIRISADLILFTEYSSKKFDKFSPAQRDSLMGEREIDASDPVLDKLDPVVSGMTVRLGRLPAPR